MSLSEFQEVIVNIIAVASLFGLCTGFMIAIFGRK